MSIPFSFIPDGSESSAALIALRVEADKAIETMIEENEIAIENLTKRQVAEAFKQAIASGDFQRHVRVGYGAQEVLYMPYARVQELEFRIQDLEKILKDNGITEPRRIRHEEE